jgi:hypothetical protein
MGFRNVSEELASSLFRVIELVHVDVEEIGRKQMCRLCRKIWGKFCALTDTEGERQVRARVEPG